MATKTAEAEVAQLGVRDNPLGRRAVYSGRAEIPAITSDQVPKVAAGLGVAVPLYRSNLAADFQAGALRRGARLSFQARLTLKVWDDRQAALRLYLRRPVEGVEASAREEAGKRLLRRRLCVLAWRSRAGTFGPGREKASGLDLSRVRLGSVLEVEVVITKQGWPYLLRADVEWGSMLDSDSAPEQSDPLPVEEAGPPGTHPPIGGDGEQEPSGEEPPQPEEMPSEEVARDEEAAVRSNANSEAGETPGARRAGDAGEESEGQRKPSGGETSFERVLPTGFSLPAGTPIREGDVLLAGEGRLGRVEWHADEGRFFVGAKPLRDRLWGESEEVAVARDASPVPTREAHA